MKRWCGSISVQCNGSLVVVLLKNCRLRISFPLFHMHDISLKKSVPKSMKETRECFLRLPLDLTKFLIKIDSRLRSFFFFSFLINVFLLTELHEFNPDAHSESSQTLKDWKSSTIFAKISILDVSLGSEYASVSL